MKNFGKVFLATTIMTIFAMQAQSQNNTAPVKQQDQKQKAAISARGNFVDKNNDSICDNFESRQGQGRGRNFVDKNNDGICDNLASRSGQGRGRNFVDKNNDGICDNRATVGKNSGKPCRNGKGRQYRNGQGQGLGRGQGQVQDSVK